MSKRVVNLENEIEAMRKQMADVVGRLESLEKTRSWGEMVSRERKSSGGDNP